MNEEERIKVIELLSRLVYLTEGVTDDIRIIAKEKLLKHLEIL